MSTYLIIMKALPLTIFVRADRPADCPDPPYILRLVESTLQVLNSHFSSFPLVLPIFVTGSTWKGYLLGALLKHSHPDLENPESCFECEEGADDGVYVWPEPVHIGGVTLMLLKLRKPISEEGAYMELRKKVTVGLTMLSSVSCLCEERSQALSSLDAFVKDYTSISQSSSLKVSKLLMFIDDSWCKTSNDKAAYEKRRNEYGSLLDVRCRDKGKIEGPWVQPLVDILADAQFHQPFQKSHSRLYENRKFMPFFEELAAAIVQKANEMPTFEDFVSEFHSYSPPCMKSMCLIELARLSGSRSFTAKINPETADLVRANFAQTEKFFPVFDYCLVGRSSLFAACLKQVFPDLEDPEGCFESGEVDEVYVWPQPVQLGNVTLMLLKQGRPINDDATYLELRRKVMMGLMMISSVCYLSEESGNVLGCVQNILKDYENASQHLQLKMSKMEVFIENQRRKIQNWQKCPNLY